MKKFCMLLLAALPILAVSCGNDDPDPVDPVDINFDLTQLRIDYGKDGQLKCNIEGAEIKSDNPFIATVDPSGKVTAKHVGETKIRATYDGHSATATVTVLPTNDNFVTPLLLWGASMDQIKLKMSQTDNMVAIADMPENSLGYTTAGNLPVYSYSFVTNRLTSAGMTITEEQDEQGDMTEFLTQRYKMYGDNGDTGEMFFCNADEVKDATVLVSYGMDLESDDPVFNVIWRENDGTKTRATGAFSSSDFDACRALLRQAAKSVK